jgi:hypothetical protein
MALRDLPIKLPDQNVQANKKRDRSGADKPHIAQLKLIYTGNLNVSVTHKFFYYII